MRHPSWTEMQAGLVRVGRLTAEEKLSEDNDRHEHRPYGLVEGTDERAQLFTKCGTIRKKRCRNTAGDRKSSINVYMVYAEGAK
ncbi:Hypothetical protein CINCED_3A017592 [Cinara cedri]|uniref:Uncharacterized protein n=1 Tax=Cinara cedri TaxID=506608 RepID=A0A5E4M906_9HEMI|nr:Hypothetical protein CINCED_3A017592 [Cinara cedri]